MEIRTLNVHYIRRFIWMILLLLPVGVTAYTIYWIVLVSQKIFLNANGAGNLILGLLIIISSLVSASFGFKSLFNLQIHYEDYFFSVYIVSTFISFILNGVALIATSIEHQQINNLKIQRYVLFNNDSVTQGYNQDYASDYQKMTYCFSYGQNSFETFFIFLILWVISFVSFFAFSEIEVSNSKE